MLRAILISQDSPGQAHLVAMLRQVGFDSTLQWTKPATLLTQTLTPSDVVFVDLDSVPAETTTWEDGFGNLFNTIRALQIPLILLVSRSVPIRFLYLLRNHGTQGSVLKKPFFSSELQFAVGKACSELQKYPKQVLFVGPEIPPSLIRELEHETQTRILHARGTQELRHTLKGKLLSIPTLLLVDEKAMSTEMGDLLYRLKSSFQGRRTLVVALSQDPKLLGPIRETVDLAYAHKGSWRIWFEELNKLNDQWTYARLALEQIKRLLGQGRAKEARTAAKAALKHIPMNLRLHYWLARVEQALGRPDEALKHLSFALRWNPCLPGLYIFALRFHSGEKARNFLMQALLYCPQHPELLLKWNHSQAREHNSSHVMLGTI